jgi:2-desacetyl-2-hydroxyethyl bacteriochlorophyllide A dehydrogenase
MKGIMFVEKGKAVLQEEEAPTCRPGHILCKTLFSGVTNGTERNVLMGGNYCGGWPGRCGYQNVGCVLAAGEGVEAYKEGDIVFSGQFSQHVERFVVNVSDPESEGNLVIRVPKSVDLKHAALFGMVSVAMHDVRRAEVRLGDRALVVGAGGIGQFTAQAARAAGAHVTVCDLNEERLAIAAKLGAHRTVTVSDEESWKQVGSGGQFDMVFEDSGAPILDGILRGFGGKRLIKHRGKLVLIAGRHEVTYSFNAGQGAEVAVLHAGHFQRSDLKEVCRLVADGVIRVGPLIRDVVPISDAVPVYERLRDNPGSLLGTVFDWQTA